MLCVITSDFWREARSGTAINTGRQARALANGWFLFLLAYLQLVIGAHLRHPNVTWQPGVFRSLVVMHLVVAAFLLIQAATIAWRSRQLGAKQLSRPARLIPALVTTQVLLGILTWRAKYGWPTFLPIPDSWTVSRFTLPAESMEQALTVTSHVAVGSLILAASVCYATRLTRCYFLSRGRIATSASPGSYTSFPRIEGAVS
jgi:cytochrome c oxidase assembly protein subunit 15